MQTVLYIDDDRNDLLLFQRACQLAQVSFSLRVVAGGLRAITYLQGQGEYADRNRHPLPCFILLDLKMPQRDGFEVLGWLRSTPTTHHLPVAIYTASLIQKDVRRAYAAGANYFITKPSDITVMMDVARAIDTCLLTTDPSNCQALERFSAPR